MIEKIEQENEIIIDGCRVYVENGEVKIIFSEKIRRRGGLAIEEAYELTCAAIDILYDMKEKVK